MFYLMIIWETPIEIINGKHIILNKKNHSALYAPLKKIALFSLPLNATLTLVSLPSRPDNLACLKVQTSCYLFLLPDKLERFLFSFSSACYSVVGFFSFIWLFSGQLLFPHLQVIYTFYYRLSLYLVNLPHHMVPAHHHSWSPIWTTAIALHGLH